MDNSLAIAGLTEQAIAPFVEGDPRLVREAALMVGRDGMEIEEVAIQLGLDPDVLWQAVAYSDAFRMAVDAARAAKAREMEGQSRRALAHRLQQADGLMAEITEGEARALRAVQAIYKEAKAGEREHDRRKERRQERIEQAGGGQGHHSTIVVENVEAHDLEGTVPVAEPQEV